MQDTLAQKQERNFCKQVDGYQINLSALERHLVIYILHWICFPKRRLVLFKFLDYLIICYKIKIWVVTNNCF